VDGYWGDRGEVCEVRRKGEGGGGGGKGGWMIAGRVTGKEAERKRGGSGEGKGGGEIRGECGTSPRPGCTNNQVKIGPCGDGKCTVGCTGGGSG